MLNRFLNYVLFLKRKKDLKLQQRANKKSLLCLTYFLSTKKEEEVHGGVEDQVIYSRSLSK